MTLGDALGLGHLNILKYIGIFKFEYLQLFLTLGDALGHLNILKDIGIFKFEYPEIFLDIGNFP